MQRLHNQQNKKEKKEILAIDKCSNENWRLKIYKFVLFGVKIVNFMVKSKISFVYIKGFKKSPSFIVTFKSRNRGPFLINPESFKQICFASTDFFLFPIC